MKDVYNTGKVKIGLAYEPPTRVELSLDEERIQAALLRNRTDADSRSSLFTAIITIAAAAAAIAIFAGATA